MIKIPTEREQNITGKDDFIKTMVFSTRKCSVIVYSLLIHSYLPFMEVSSDKPCAARTMKNASAVCVCNATYCDEYTRVAPDKDTYFKYTSSKAGLRLERTRGSFESRENGNSSSLGGRPMRLKILKLDPKTQYQKIEGFGGAATDSATYNWRSLSKDVQTAFINSYFSDKGNEYNIVRVPIGGSDFSLRAYAYNEMPVNDRDLTNYTLAAEDYDYKIPFIQQASKASPSALRTLAVVWSPPKWMKTNNQLYGYGQLKKEYYQTYADYHIKFIQEYEKNNISIWGLSTTNEPLNGIITLVVYNDRLNCLGWFPDDLARWIVQNLGPTLRNSSCSHVKLFTLDDQRYSIPAWFYRMVDQYPEILKYIEGVALHFYADDKTPVSILTEFKERFPDLKLLSTEACEGAPTTEIFKVALGSWKRANGYAANILTNLNNNFIGWIDWNMALNLQGGPTYIGNYVDSPVIVFPERDEFVKQPMFYALAHFTKFLPRNSRRIRVVRKKSVSLNKYTDVAFLTPRDTIVVILQNTGSKCKIAIQVDDKEAIVDLDAQSFTTVEFPYHKPPKEE